MTIKQKLEKLALERTSPCVTISLKTHRTLDKTSHDEILLKNLLSEAEKRLLAEYGKREIASLLEKIQTIPSKIDMRYNLESLHIFLSNETEEFIRSPWNISQNSVQVTGSFNIRHLIKKFNRVTEYLILFVSKGGSQLYLALNDGIEEEIKNTDFPISETPHYVTSKKEASNPKLVDDLTKEYLNKVDKALLKVANDLDLPCVVIATEDNYTKLLEVADRPNVYVGFRNVNYNETSQHALADQAWNVMLEKLQSERREAIEEMKKAINQRKVLTDLQEIYRASLEGRGDLLIVHQNFSQSVIMKAGERSFKLTDESAGKDVIDDITSDIAWNVLSKKGRVVFTTQDEIKDLGNIVLKLRY